MNPLRPIVVIGLIVFCQVLCVGANFPTIGFYSESFGRSGMWVGALWIALTVPRAVLSPFWGSLSDLWGRKPLLILGSLASIAGSLLWAVAGSWEMLLTSRMIDGFLAAQATIGFSVIADATTPERRASAMGLVGAMVMMGFTLGPAMGSLVAGHWGFHTLGFMMAGVQAAGLLLVLFAMPETRPVAAANHGALPDAFKPSQWNSVLASHNAKGLLGASLILMLAYSVYNTAFQNATKVWLGWTVRDMAAPFVVLGLGGAVAQGGLVRQLVPRFGERALSLAGIALMCVGFAALAFNLGVPWLLGATLVLAVGGGLSFPCLTSLLSRSTNPERQGLVMGLNQMAQGLGRGAGFLIGSLFAANPALLTMPYWIAIGALIVGGVLVPRKRMSGPD